MICAVGVHPVPSRTRQLSPPAPMVVCGSLHARVGHCQHSLFIPPKNQPDSTVWFLFLYPFSTFTSFSSRISSYPFIHHSSFSIDNSSLKTACPSFSGFAGRSKLVEYSGEHSQYKRRRPGQCVGQALFSAVQMSFSLLANARR